MALGIAPFAVGMIGSVVTGAIAVSSALGIGCAFGHKYCAFTGSGSKEPYHGRRDLSVSASVPALDITAMFQINNTDLSRDDLSRLAGLRADVLDIAGNALFKSDYFDRGKGIIIEINPTPDNGSTLALPKGMGKGEFSFTLPHAIKPETTVQGTWVYLNREIADDKIQNAFDQIRNVADSLSNTAQLDLASMMMDDVVKFLGSTLDKSQIVASPDQTVEAVPATPLGDDHLVDYNPPGGPNASCLDRFCVESARSTLSRRSLELSDDFMNRITNAIATGVSSSKAPKSFQVSQATEKDISNVADAIAEFISSVYAGVEKKGGEGLDPVEMVKELTETVANIVTPLLQKRAIGDDVYNVTAATAEFISSINENIQTHGKKEGDPVEQARELAKAVGDLAAEIIDHPERFTGAASRAASKLVNDLP